jgi:hypothetical protein
LKAHSGAGSAALRAEAPRGERMSRFRQFPLWQKLLYCPREFPFPFGPIT